jgi:hypothetical protein
LPFGCSPFWKRNPSRQSGSILNPEESGVDDFSLRDPQPAVFVLNSSPISFFTRPYINIRSVKA